MNATETMIKKLCMDCPRRDNVCREEKPSFADAYRCKYDEAVRELNRIAKLFDN